ncbi:hypothetical protein J1N35_004783 [Gossypium stocksii]|uniref:Uncharacterized protein n=1 Tax=Gossypium stocksii TaxID=47602 RepID=A0A9D4AID0_9ROSI|nr:hypothetical protein J1N35_004783 [Gossypium stocksii]
MCFVEAKKVRKNEKKQVECFSYKGLHRMRDCLERYKLSIVTKEDEVELESEALKLGSMILNSAKAKRNHKQKGLMYMDINIVSKRKNAPIDTRASDLFILDKVWVNLISRLANRPKRSRRFLKRVSRGAYKQKLETTLKVNPVFYVGVSEPICADQEDPDRGNWGK